MTWSARSAEFLACLTVPQPGHRREELEPGRKRGGFGVTVGFQLQRAQGLGLLADFRFGRQLEEPRDPVHQPRCPGLRLLDVHQQGPGFFLIALECVSIGTGCDCESGDSIGIVHPQLPDSGLQALQRPGE